MSLSQRLSQLERQLQKLFEGQAARWIPTGTASSDLAYSLVSALNAGIEHTKEGQILAPDSYLVRIAGSEDPWLDDPGQLKAAAELLQGVAEAAGLVFVAPVALTVEALPNPAEFPFQVIASFSRAPVSQTAAIEIGPPTANHVRLQGFFLIVDGTRRFDLDAIMINIGRHAGNQLVIAEEGVSRQHAQLRYSPAGFVLFDLDSTTGTWVNGQRKQRCTLRSGDVISIGGIPLLYQVESPSLSSTQSYPPES